eukprot:gnl/MRDRNA2_/MRDRNA2_75073_c0_seq1.p1 gnl/MRDRNA2_/MRDRNA2_75073_c0~~gnl/MRDRNA2_/MRDRNA2_75073_c0_seq1.p1  ORF type:complete len:340 (+),score=37.41 gnl/MRDRNA2_/MRDRNA2_75073_c0_seq1:65-1084(+)
MKLCFEGYKVFPVYKRVFWAISALCWLTCVFLFDGVRFPEFVIRNFNGLQFHSLDFEFPEQAYLYAWLPRDAAVLSIGGNIGTTCVFIDRLLWNPSRSRHLCVEPDLKVKSALELNRQETGSLFGTLDAIIARPAIGNISFTFLGWSSHVTRPGETPSYSVPTVDLDVSNFSAVVMDCEGCYCELFKSIPEILDMQLLLLEVDAFPPRCEYNYEALLAKHSYARVDGSLSFAGPPHHAVYMKGTTWKPWSILSHLSQFCVITMRNQFPFMFPEPAMSLYLFYVLACIVSLTASGFFTILCVASITVFGSRGNAKKLCGGTHLKVSSLDDIVVQTKAVDD